MGAALCGSYLFVNTEFLKKYSTASGAFAGQVAGDYHNVLTSQLASDGHRVYVTGETGVFSVTCG